MAEERADRFSGSGSPEAGMARGEFLQLTFWGIGSVIIVGGMGYLLGRLSPRAWPLQIPPIERPIYNPQVIIKDEGEPLVLTPKELEVATMRVEHMADLVHRYIIQPDINLNVSGAWNLSEGEKARLMATANPNGRKATWEFTNEDTYQG